MITSSQLFDICKAKKLATHVGERGGRYYVSSKSGERVYVGKEAGLRVAAGPVDERLQFQMHHRPDPHVINWPTTRSAVRIAQENWPAYVCRSCHQPVVPKHDSPVMTGIHSATHGVGPAKIEESPGGYIATPKKVGETVRVRVLDPKTQKVRTEYGWKPEWVASRLCDKCFERKAPAYEKRQEKREERKTEAHIEAGLQHARQSLILKRESAKAESNIRKKASGEAKKRARVEATSKVKKSVGIWLTL